MFNNTPKTREKRLRWSANVRRGYLLRRARGRVEWLLCVLTLIGLAMLLMGCATPPPPSSETQVLPSKPALSQPLPSEKYSDRVLRNIKLWESRLMGTLPTQ